MRKRWRGSSCAVLFAAALAVLAPIPYARVSAEDPPPDNNPVGLNVARLSQERFVAATAGLVNTNGGDWGYITITWTVDDRDSPQADWLLEQFLDRCYEYHLNPIIRVSTWHEQGPERWVRPDWDEPARWRAFLERGKWPNRPVYVSVGNEPNLGFEWGGEVDAADYARYLAHFVDVFQDSDTFRVVNAPLDISNGTRLPEMQDAFEFIDEMRAAVPDIFDRLSAWASNPYRVPSGGEDIRYTHLAYRAELAAIGQELPVIIAESSLMETDDDYAIADYYDHAFRDWMDDRRVLAATPLFWNPNTNRFWMFTPNPDGSVGLMSPTYQRIRDLPKRAGSPSYTPPIARAPRSSASALFASPPSRGSHADVPAGASRTATAARFQVANTGGAGANVRAEPSPSAARVAGIPEGELLDALAPELEVDGRHWLLVRTPDGTEGWVAADLLVQVSGDE